MLDRIFKWWALGSYRRNLPSLLVRRYGRRPGYTPPQVLATIRAHRLNETYAAHACAMFCSKQAYDAFVAGRVPDLAYAGGPSMDSDPFPAWASMSLTDWPSHHELMVDVPSTHAWEHKSFDWGGGGEHHGGDHAAGGHFDGGHHGGHFDGGHFDSGGSDGGHGSDGGGGSDGGSGH